MKYTLVVAIIILSFSACGDHNPSGSDQKASDSTSAINTPLPNDVEASSNTDNRPDSVSGNTTGRGSMNTTDSITSNP